MIAFENLRNESRSDWQQGFMQILPELESRLRRSHRYLDSQKRDEFTKDGLVHCLLAYIRLTVQGRADSVTPANLVWYATLQPRSGREAACQLSGRDPLSPYARRRKRITVETASSSSQRRVNWIDLIVEDKRASVADQVVARLDIRAWIAKMPLKLRSIARDLAEGGSTSEVARKHGITAGRISQLRREFKTSWSRFQREC
jgi:hypothetical protein